MSQGAFFHNPGVQPRPNQPLNPSIFHPPAQHLASPGLANTVEVSTDICIHNPANTLVHAPLAEFVQRIMRAATLPKAIGAVVKVLLVDRFQQHRHRSLDNLVLERRLADRALAPIYFFEPDGVYRWFLVGSTAKALEQFTQLLVTVL